MSYRREWRHCKRFFPKVYCSIIGSGFRVVSDRSDPRMYAEFYSLGNGSTRLEAWKDAASCATIGRLAQMDWIDREDFMTWGKFERFVFEPEDHGTLRVCLQFWPWFIASLLWIPLNYLRNKWLGAIDSF